MADANIRAQNEEEQCTSSDERGNRCTLARVDESPYCAKHGGKKNERQLMQNYRLTKWRAEVQSKLRSDSILSLREEIGISRLTLEEMLNACQSSVDLLMYQPKIVQLVQTIQKTVESCQRVEERTANLLSKAALLQFADEVVQIISQHVQDPTIRNCIANELMLKLERIANDV